MYALALALALPALVAQARDSDPRGVVLEATLALALVTACGDDSTGPDGPTARYDIGEMARDEVEAATQTALHFDGGGCL